MEDTTRERRKKKRRPIRCADCFCRDKTRLEKVTRWIGPPKSYTKTVQGKQVRVETKGSSTEQVVLCDRCRVEWGPWIKKEEHRGDDRPRRPKRRREDARSSRDPQASW